MTALMEELLERSRHAGFVGRERELTAFGDVIAGRSTRRLLFVHGLGGIGKTTLLRAYEARARRVGLRPALIPAGELLGTAEQRAHRLSRVLQVLDRPNRPSVGAVGAVLMVDEFERFESADVWMREEFLPRLPAHVLVVIASRNPPSPQWRADPGWRHVVEAHHLDVFDRATSAELVARAGLRAPECPPVLRLGQGHPFALAMLADLVAGGIEPRSFADAPAIVTALMSRIVGGTPSEAHAMGLIVCATAWLTTEELLGEVLGARAGEVWDWLQRQSFVRTGPRGLWLDALVRDVVEADARRRMPQRSRTLYNDVMAQQMGELRKAASGDRLLLAQHALLGCRPAHPFGRAADALREHSDVSVDRAVPHEHAVMTSAIARGSGPRAARLAAAWLDEKPQGLSVSRHGSHAKGFCYRLRLPDDTKAQTEDPVVPAVLGHVAGHAPLRAGEHIDVVRFLTGGDAHERDPFATLAMTTTSLIEWVSRSPAWSFVIVTDEDHWRPCLERLGFTRLVEVDVDGVTHVGFGHDWRRLPADTWFTMMREREASGDTGPPPAPMLSPPPLDPDVFATAVKAALRDLHRPERLATNPLMGTVLSQGPDGACPERLRTVLERSLAGLADDRSRSVLERTFLYGCPTQEAAAQSLAVSLSTYRRRLAMATDQLTEALWRADTGQPADFLD